MTETPARARFARLTSTVAPLLEDDVDTDQIIPARYLKSTDKRGMGDHLFTDWRHRPDGSPDPEFVLNREELRGARVLLAGANFGCGSSREHAVWALAGWGFQAVVATSFADIFRNNALKNGLLVVPVQPDVHASLAAQVAADPRAEVTIDLEAQTLALPNGQTATFPIDPFARRCLLEGVDELGYLLSQEAHIQAYEARHG